ncbi:MAG TPA: methylamine utilization protein [Macromonas sp.]|nr:methylamine utilization protein [Macromonas sp.]
MQRFTQIVGAGCLLWATGATAGVHVTVQDPTGRALPDAVVFLESPTAARQARPMTGVEMAQANKAFVPQVLPVTRGTAVHFPNRDTVRHHVYSFSAIKPFELKLYIGTPANPVLFEQTGVAVLGCNIHDHMVGWVLVLDTPYFQRSDAQGVARLPQAPPDRYRLRVWHPRLPVGAAAHSQPLLLGDTAQTVTVQLRGLEP